ncbi:MAG: DUF1707 SHOCT-like domain-containing protein [Gemmatimonadota bacterium]
MDDHIRVSDADRDRVAGRLREHFAAGRLTQDELDERVSAALNARTFGELRGVLADLPEPGSAPPRPGPFPQQVPPVWLARRRGPRFLPVLLLVLLLALILPGGHWFFWGFFPFLFVFWTAACLAAIVAMTRFRRHHHHRWDGGWHPHG